MSTANDPNIPVWTLVPSSAAQADNFTMFGWDEPMGPSSPIFNFLNFGEPPFSETLAEPAYDTHLASVHYNFTGTRVVVEATIENIPKESESNWRMTCRIDGKDFPVASDIWNRQANHVPLCDAGGLAPDGVHSLDFAIHMDKIGISPQVSVDVLKVTPSSFTNLENALVYMQHDASMVAYEGSSWQANDFGHYTSTNGSKVVVNFSGTKLLWYGFYDPTLDALNGPSQGIYTVDNFPAVAFLIQRINPAIKTRYIGVPDFITGELPPGMHRLEVGYNSATASGRPLGLHHLVIQNAPLPSAIPISQSKTQSQIPTGSPSPGQDSRYTLGTGNSGGLSKPATIAIAVNAVIGGLVAIGFAFFFLRRRQKQAREKSIVAKTPLPYNSPIDPSTTSVQSPKTASATVSEGPSPNPAAISPNRKGTPLTDLPVARGSLHIRSLDLEDRPPSYYDLGPGPS